MLLDLSGLTREERVMMQASIRNERDFETSTYSSPRKPETCERKRERRIRT